MPTSRRKAVSAPFSLPILRALSKTLRLPLSLLKSPAFAPLVIALGGPQSRGKRGPSHRWRMMDERRYALALKDWLELEAQRSNSLDELWVDFEFLAEKLGFAQAILDAKNGQRFWESGSCKIISSQPLQATFALSKGDRVNLRLVASRRMMDADTFEEIARVAAQAWLRAVQAWQRTHLG